MSVGEEFWEVGKPGSFNNEGGRYMKVNPKTGKEWVAEDEFSAATRPDREKGRRVTVNPYADEDDGVPVDDLVGLGEFVPGLAFVAKEDAEDIAAAREARKEPGRIPNYYLMPNCIEVKEIARYLTSNGGQAVQYIARATRTDGIIKGNPISDLEKARDMINDEINRLKENQ